MNVANHRNRSLLVSRVDHHLVCSCHSKDHPVGQIEEANRVRILLLLVEVGVELDAGGVRFDAWEHQGGLAQRVLQKSVNCVRVAAPRLNIVSMQVIEASGRCQ